MSYPLSSHQQNTAHIAETPDVTVAAPTIFAATGSGAARHATPATMAADAETAANALFQNPIPSYSISFLDNSMNPSGMTSPHFPISACANISHSPLAAFVPVEQKGCKDANPVRKLKRFTAPPQASI
jgi:hypothetical protein